MRISASTRTAATDGSEGGKSSSSQTLLRGLDVVEAVSDGTIGLADLATRLGLTRSTTHRLAAALVERQYLNFLPREGYVLGPKLLELGFKAQQQKDLPRVARPHLETLAADTEDTVHLGVLDKGRALYLDKIPGRRRIEISSRVGERQPIRSTGLGKAMILDETEAQWAEMFDQEEAISRSALDRETWLSRMREYARDGHAFDLEENEDRIRCVAAPIRDVAGRIVGAISLSSAAQYMDDHRMASLPQQVRATAEAISRELGWSEDAAAEFAARPRRSSRP
ncbi:IclR family transcriptional regulator [Brevundimonas subvibrioides]|uniref:Transcriptional regulator, IclR family n=1 Tax=Brevundimonas subvibrioides (strain ATCC 15264 / DSM 4735 / LMG 14903 / NBRC 16000 / CB 81) TaxID=633149 RepID=D9QN19_BRESC|nr:IclR family transcriptional regulator [Brevundimonas subvibrioides]ADL02175.1 transcriptional regulator, IclR family [Brevundimonas subvibrioides ATCC 15264]